MITVNCSRHIVYIMIVARCFRIRFVLKSIVGILITVGIYILISLRIPTSSSSSSIPLNSTCNYVCFGVPKTKNRLGNHLFYFAGVQYVAWLTGRTPCMQITASDRPPLDQVFDLDIERLHVKGHCPSFRSVFGNT